VLLKIVRRGEERRRVEVHLHYYLFAEILADIASSLAGHPLDEAHRGPLEDAANALKRALAKGGGKRRSP